MTRRKVNAGCDNIHFTIEANTEYIKQNLNLRKVNMATISCFLFRIYLSLYTACIQHMLIRADCHMYTFPSSADLQEGEQKQS